MPGIDIDKLEEGLPELRRARAMLDGDYHPEVPLRDFKKLFDQLVKLTENCVFELKEQRDTIEKRDREVVDLKRRLREAGAFVP